jgi:hypothetical protein
MSDEILIPDRPKTTRIESTDDIAIGQWYWTTTQDYKGKDERWLGCVTRIGSNYAKLSGAKDDSSARVHFDNFAETCEFEPDAERIIAEQVEIHRREASRLMGEVQDITRRLAIQPRQSLNDGSETQALAVRGNTQSIPDYKAALIKAKEKDLPKLFEEIKAANQMIGNWMKAPLLAMKAEAKALESAIKSIEARIFNVELYAGLVEEVKRIKDGPPADISEPVRIFQRRAYCDEECLANYETGGMEFKDIKAFDKWLAKAENLDRLLPFKRCVLAFQVRRKTKERETPVNLSGFIKMMHEEKWDKTTFLYIRNGQQVFRLNTEIEFGSRLFPDTEVNVLSGVIYAEVFANSIDKLISEGHYNDIISKHEAAVSRWKIEQKEYKANVKAFLSKGGNKKNIYSQVGFEPSQPYMSDRYVKWSPDDVMYDDIAEKVKAEIDHHNRLVLVLQGLFDRSPVFHPHPPYQLWSGDSFIQAIKLIYDDSRGLVAGDKPDFEAYRARLNASLKKGSITVGQDDFWQRKEADKHNRECRANWRIRHHTDAKRHKPYGNPGPGKLAMVKAYSTKGASYKWERERQGYSRYSDDKPINCNLTVPVNELLNVDAYQPGDFKQFFNDPRTRADYLEWAVLLLTAEEWHAGNRKVDGKTISQLPKKRFIVPKKVYRDFSGKIFFTRSMYNPHRRGSIGYESYQIVADNPGIDLKAYKAKGGHRGWLIQDIDKGRIRETTDTQLEEK